MKQFWTAIALVLGAVFAIGWLAWKCDRDPNINFLPRDGRAEWIFFPAAIDALAHPVAMMDATFRRTFTLGSQPKSARLLFRAAKRVELKINGERVEIVPARNWKQISNIDVSNHLRIGSNAIEARVFNDDAPPALWLALTADSSTLRTNETWEASLAGSSWRNCRLASVPRHPGPGNLLAGGEKISDVLPKIWPRWVVFFVLAVLITIGLTRWNKIRGHEVDLSRAEILGLIGVCVLAWVILFLNNTRMLPFQCGYDSGDHIAYIKYIQERAALPLPNEGYEMFQPPLFYALSAGLLSIFHLSTDDAGAAIVLRVLTMIFGIANFILVFLSARLLFPNRRELQLIATLLAAFLPMQLYLSHYITNETLAGTLATATVYLCLRILKSDRISISALLVLGAVTGAAMLAKATSLLLIPPLIGALAMKLFQERASVSSWFRTFGATLGALILVCGWHYIRIWRHFGKPIVGNWERQLGFHWWQDPGFHTAADYFRFDRALMDPLFSGFNGFLDGIYSTLWGDSLGGGLSGLLSRTPWNYHLVVAGYWLALIPSLLVLIGVAIALYQLARRPSPEGLLLIGFSGAIVFGLIFMTLRVASYAQVKAFYGLSGVVPFCWFAALGWKAMTRLRRFPSFLLFAVLLFFSFNSFGSVWIRKSADQHLYAAFRLIRASQLDRALSEATEAVKSDPSNANASFLLAAVLDEIGESAKAITQCEDALHSNPVHGNTHLQLGISVAKQGELTRALSEGRRALELLPENARAYDLIFSVTRELHRSDEALTIERDALIVSPFNSDLHYRIGLAAGETGNFEFAVPQFAYALLLQPSRTEISQKLHLALVFAAQSPNAPDELAAIAVAAPDLADLRNQLAWIFATNSNREVRNGTEALRQSERACALTNRSRPDFLATLAAAYAETSNFSEAISTAQEARRLANDRGDEKNARLAETLIATFQTNQPYREKTP